MDAWVPDMFFFGTRMSVHISWRALRENNFARFTYPAWFSTLLLKLGDTCMEWEVKGHSDEFSEEMNRENMLSDNLYYMIYE